MGSDSHSILKTILNSINIEKRNEIESEEEYWLRKFYYSR